MLDGDGLGLSGLVRLAGAVADPVVPRGRWCTALSHGLEGSNG
ncbi:hypothetical protein [Streptomyces sp. NPDC059224]